MANKIIPTFVLSLLAFLPILGRTSASDKPEEVIKLFDVSSYHPNHYGLKDLVVDIRISELLKQLNEKLIFGTLTDVYFRIYWVHDGKSDIEIFGMPKGFNEIKAELMGLVANRIDYLIPKLLAPDLKGYKLSVLEKSENLIRIKAVDPDHIKFVHEIDLEFDRQNQLRKMVTYSPMGAEEAAFVSSRKPWGQNKWVTDEVQVSSSQGAQSTVVVNRIVYEKIDGMGFPVRIETNTKQTLLQPTTANDVYKREINNVLLFSNYKINTGEAKTFFQKKR